ncbi:hypothetical protein MRGA327_07180 [Mycobacterium tuberculosis RGTB327]|nr:hypothetical protein MRGA327_07180 [Mycobacterium tuberculosis RGTB327]
MAAFRLAVMWIDDSSADVIKAEVERLSTTATCW